jgi:predicted alternative tryptophan synthase beta-subunit
MRYHVILPSIALLAFAGVAGAQSTAKSTPSSASKVATGAKVAAPADTTAKAVSKSHHRRRRNAASTAKTKPAADSSMAHKATAMPSASAKTSTKKP